MMPSSLSSSLSSCAAVVTVIALVTGLLVNRVSSLACFDCRADDTTCNVGECHGMVCVKMEIANLDNDRKTVQKSCTDDYEETQCKQSSFGSKLNTRCTCDTGPFCNGDSALAAAGLASSRAAPTFRTLNFIAVTFLGTILPYLTVRAYVG